MSVSIYVHRWDPLDACPFKPGLYKFTHKQFTRYNFLVCRIDGHDVFKPDRTSSSLFTHKYRLDPDVELACLSDSEHINFLEIEQFLKLFGQSDILYILRIDDAREEAERYVTTNKRVVYRDKMFSLVHLPPLVIAKVFQSLV